MLLVRTIILKLILALSSASLIDVINLTINKSDGSGMAQTETVWLTENRPIKFHIESDAIFEHIGCTIGGKLIMLYKEDEDLYAPENTITTTATMTGTWKCTVIFGRNTNIAFDIKVKVGVDECKATPYRCLANANCTNTPGSYICTCFPGYTGDGITHCQAVDKCLPNPCRKNEQCHNEETDYRCAAKDPCKPNPCHENAICMDQKTDYKCECRSGFTGDGHSCSVDPCQPNACHAKATCNRVGHHPGFECKCIKGYDGDGHTCREDPCQPNPCHANATCNRVGNHPGFLCECNRGYEGDGHTCRVNPCQSHPCHAMATCNMVEYDPGFECECIKGYDGNGIMCTELNDCQYHDICHSEAKCVNAYPNHTCQCRTGFKGDGYSSCSDIDECESHCQGYKETCKNTIGSFYCQCLEGYHKNYKGVCEDIDVCKSYPCEKNEQCFNTKGNFTCCPKNSILDKGRCFCAENYIDLDIQGCVYNQCVNTTCGQQAMCNIINNKPVCQCPSSTTGDPYKQCAVLAKPAGSSTNRGPRDGKSSEQPSIDIHIYIKNKAIVHYTTVDELFINQDMTIGVSSDLKNFKIKEKQTMITCDIKENKTVHLNRMLELKRGSKYIAKGLKADSSMNGNWVCLIQRSYADAVKSSGPANLPAITVEFPVKINKVPVTELPNQTAFVPTDGMIYIEMDNDNATAKSNTLLTNQPFTIVIKKTSNDIRNITNIKCHYIGNEGVVFTRNQNLIWDKEQRVYTAQQRKASKKMRNTWKCNITYYKEELDSEYDKKEKYGPSHCVTYFDVLLKDSELVKYSNVSVNDVIVQTTQEDENEVKGTYEYFVEEIVKVSCEKSDSAQLMNMQYFDGNSFGPETQTSSNEIQTMYLKVGEGLNKHVYCNVIVNDKFNQKQNLRLDFIKRKSHPSGSLPTFNVNGLTLAPRLSADGNYYKVFYEYFTGEFIHFTVYNRQGWNTDENLKEADPNGDKLIYSDYAQKKTIKFYSNYHIKTLIFNLRPDSNHFGATVSGLPFSQTNVKYFYNSTTYRTEFFNKNNTVLNLACSSPDYKNCKWDQNLTMTNVITDSFIKNITFLPEDHTDQSTVLKCICESVNKRGSLKRDDIHEVTILRDSYIKPTSERPEGKEEKDTSDASSDASTEYSRDASPPGDTSSESKRTLILVVITVVVLIVVAAVLWLMVGLYKRRQRREKAIQSEFNYASLENTSERTMPAPAQWDNYVLPVDRQKENDTETYSVPYQQKNVEDMYTKPQPKSLRKPPNETLYAEPSYAAVEQFGDRPTYGNLNQTAEYSQIKPKKLIGNPNAPKVLPTESPYAEVMPKSMRPNSSKYANVFDNQRYINANKGESSEYAEPAYCEVGFKNK